MKIIFFGTPDFALLPLKKIYNSKHQVIAVVTAPDKERGRGRRISFTPVKTFALEHNLPLLQPENLNESDFINKLKSFSADLFVIVAFRILPEAVFTMPPKGSFNLHASLLPLYRGAAPIQWALINGEKQTGVTTFFLEKKVDTGNIIYQKKVNISDEDNFGTLHDKLSIIGAEAVLKTIDIIEKDNITLLKQDELKISFAPKITKDICRINWNKSADEINNLIRGLSPYPGAFFEYKGKNYKLFKALPDLSKQDTAGNIVQSKNELKIGCGKGILSILEIQPEGRKRMKINEFLRGNSLI